MAIPDWLHGKLERLHRGGDLPVAVEMWDGSRIDPGTDATVTLRLTAPTALRYLRRPDLAALGEAYVEGAIDVDGPIADTIRIAEGLATDDNPARPGRRPRLRNLHSRRRDRDAIQYHYDVSNDFYALWLDPGMVYSCAYYRDGNEDLATAQAQKLDHICRKLRLQPGDRLLDIGCGWGSLVIWAATHYGVDATGITLSEAQHALAGQRIAEAGLADRCRVRLQDYRDVPGEGQFNKIASVGMVEHVGLKNLPSYFATIMRLLADGGLLLNHGITSSDTRNRWVGLGGGEFIDRYVFPHGELVHLATVLETMHRAGLEVMDVETLRHHYARTLRCWSEALERRLDEARALVEPRTLRIWRIYLAGCAHAFTRSWISIQQVLGVKNGDPGEPVLPWSRADIYRGGG